MTDFENKYTRIVLCFIFLELIIYSTLVSDVGIDEGGHVSYIRSLASNINAFGNTQINSYASEPFLYYLISALLLKILNSMLILKLMWLIPIFIAIIYIFKLIKLTLSDYKARLIAYSVVAFHPTYALNISRISNENFLIFFSALMFYFLIKYFEEINFTFKKNVLLGILLGLGILSKQQMLVFVPFLFFYFLFRTISSKDLKSEFMAFASIILIGSMIGSSYYISNHLMYNNIMPQKYIDPTIKYEGTLKEYLVHVVYFPFRFPIIGQIQNNFVHHYGNLGVGQIYVNKKYYETFFIVIILSLIGVFLGFIKKIFTEKIFSKQEIIILLLMLISAGTIFGILFETYTYRLKGFDVDIIRSGLFDHLILAEAVIFGFGLTSVFRNLFWNKVLTISFILFILFANLAVLFYYYIPYYLFGVMLY